MSNERNTKSDLFGSALVNEAEGTQSMNQSSVFRGEGMGASRPERIQRKISTMESSKLTRRVSVMDPQYYR